MNPRFASTVADALKTLSLIYEVRRMQTLKPTHSYRLEDYLELKFYFFYGNANILL